MDSFSFPNMLTSSGAKIIKDHEATISNTRLLLASWKTSFIGDPYYGTNVKKFIHEQNNIILADIIIDDIYQSLVDFIPQIALKRNDINVYIKKDSVYCTIKGINRIDNVNDLFEIKLTEDTE